MRSRNSSLSSQMAGVKARPNVDQALDDEVTCPDPELAVPLALLFAERGGIILARQSGNEDALVVDSICSKNKRTYLMIENND